jgi:midasin
LSQYTDSSDLLGGLKPIVARRAVALFLPRFDSLVRRTWPYGINDNFLARVSSVVERGRECQGFEAIYNAASKLKREISCNRNQKVTLVKPDSSKIINSMEFQTSTKRISDECKDEWATLIEDVKHAERLLINSETGFAFSSVEGAIVQAVKRGDWLLLDELNLACPEVLEGISGLLETTYTNSLIDGSLTFTEGGDLKPARRHPSFRLFSAMNPASFGGKRSLPINIANQFMEIYVNETDTLKHLRDIAGKYLDVLGSRTLNNQVVDLYINAKTDALYFLPDRAGYRPIYSLRTFCRTLEYVRAFAPIHGITRALIDGFAMLFLTPLDLKSTYRLIMSIKTLLPEKNQSEYSYTSFIPSPSDSYILLDHYWIEVGTEKLPSEF